MKRPANAAQLSSDNPKPSKASRTLDVPEYFADHQFEVPWADIQHVLTESEENVDEEPGWIIGTIAMKWPIRDPKILLQDPSKKHQLEIVFTKASLKKLDLSIRDTVKLSLRNARLELKRGGSSASKMPFSLKFPGHVAVMYVLKNGKPELDGNVVDTSELDVPPPQEDWYATPAQPNHDVDMDGSSETNRSQHTTSPFPRPAASSPLSPPYNQSQSASPIPNLAHSNVLTSPCTPAPVTPPSNKPSQVREASSPVPLPERVADGVFLADNNPVDMPPKSHKYHDKLSNTTKDDGGQRTADDLQPLNGTDLNQNLKGNDGLKNAAPTNEKKKRKSKKARYRQSNNQKSASPCPPPPPARNPSLDMQPGLKAPPLVYPALGSVDRNTRSLIGVVVSDALPALSKTNDFFVTLQLADPSNALDRPFTVTCYTKTNDAFLPPARKGHIVLVQGVKVSSWHGHLNGIVYCDRLKWVAFDPSTGRFYHKELGGVSKADAGLGPIFDPFYKPRDAEIDYFVKLGQWWRAYTENEQGPIVVCQPSKPRREHSLIGDMEANVFFDATVEVLSNDFNRDVGQHCILVSDYTPHPQLSSGGLMGQYAIQCLTDKVPKETLTEMAAGTFWSVKNLRLKYGSIGTLECDFYAVELRRLSEEADGESVPLQELLKRKEAFRTMCPPEDPSKNVNGGLSIISDLREGYCCDVIAELAHRSNDVDKCTDLYVTDYSTNAMPSYKPDRVFKKIGDTPIFVIGVYGDRDITHDLKPGSTHLFKKVKITVNEFGKIKGKLNYADTNIVKVSSRTQDETILSALKALNERKSKFFATQSSDTTTIIAPPGLSLSPLHHRHGDQKFTIGGTQEIRANGKCPNKFRIRARIVDYYPFDLHDFSVLRCKKCKTDISTKLYSCVKCDDLSRSLAEWYYRFFLRLEDEHGGFLVASVCDEGAIFMDGLKASDLRSDSAALVKVTERLKRICAPVIEVHEGAEGVDGQPNVGPLLDICVKSWPITVDGISKRGYAITGCDIASSQVIQDS